MAITERVYEEYSPIRIPVAGGPWVYVHDEPGEERAYVVDFESAHVVLTEGEARALNARLLEAFLDPDGDAGDLTERGDISWRMGGRRSGPAT